MTASENQIVVYQPNEAVRLDVRIAEIKPIAEIGVLTWEA